MALRLARHGVLKERGDGRGHFETAVLAHAMGFHETRLADLDGDGRLDILQKPYNWNAPRVDVWLNHPLPH